MAASKFKPKTTAAAAPAPARKPVRPAPPKKKQGRFAGIESAQARTPMFPLGDFRVRLLEARESTNPGTGKQWIHLKFEITESNSDELEVGQEREVLLHMGAAGMSRYKACIVALLGMSGDAEYKEFDEEGELLDALLGYENDFSPEVENVLGRECFTTVSRGKPIDDGSDFYREFAWFPIEEGE